jgi:hypothetical protein
VDSLPNSAMVTIMKASADIKMIAAQIDSVINRDHHAQGPYSGNCHKKKGRGMVQRCESNVKEQMLLYDGHAEADHRELLARPRFLTESLRAGREITKGAIGKACSIPYNLIG